MALVFTAPFAQTPINTNGVVTAIPDDITGDTPTNTQLICTAGSDGALVTSLTSIVRATNTAMDLYLWISSDAGTTKRLLNTALLAAHTVAVTTKIPVIDFGYTEDAPLRLEAGELLYVGIGVALAGGIVFTCQSTDF